MDFEIHLRSLRGHKGVKSQIYKDAQIELKFQYNDPYDILSILKIFCNSFEVIKGSQSGQRSNFQKCSDCAEIYNNDPYDGSRSQLKVIWGHRGQVIILALF